MKISQPAQAACIYSIFAILLVTSQVGCIGQSTSAESVSTVVGDMTDKSYYGQRSRVFRPNADGQNICIDQFAGRFLWSDYAAPWCGICEQQTRDMQQLEAQSGDDSVFLTVMTSDLGGYGDAATKETAARWASAFGLDPQRVIAADLTATTVPKHILFSPDGQVLFEHTGQMSIAEIQATLTRCKREWKEWQRAAAESIN